MEVKYALATLLKILISTPTILLILQATGTHGAALISSHAENSRLNNHSNPSNFTDAYYEYDLEDSQELDRQQASEPKTKKQAQSEEMPDPSALVLPGYNLPEHIFNRGKPFYVEKDPLTGQIDFSHKSPSPKLDEDMYDYLDEEPNDNIYDKSNIDRKDGSISSHRPSDVNQLTPNFHDFLNLPVKYNPEKYVYPLISSSYASMKIQGSVNKLHNHKDYVKTTKKPFVSPTYYSTSHYFSPTRTNSRPITTSTTTSTTTTRKPTTTKKYPEIYLTTSASNLMSSGLGHATFSEEFDYYDVPATTIRKTNDVYLTTERAQNLYLTTKSPTTTTTKRTMTLLEQLFGDYDETVPTTMNSPLPSPATKASKNKYQTEVKTDKPSYAISSTTRATRPNMQTDVNVLTGTSMGLDSSYDYDEYDNIKYEDNVAVPSKPVQQIDDELKIEPLHITNTSNTLSTNVTETTTSKMSTDKGYVDVEYDYPETTTGKTPVAPSTTTTVAPVRVTSLPLGENHVTTPKHDHIIRDPIIVATQNLKEKLNNEKVLPKPFEKPPSQSNIHIAPNQDTVSFIVGNQQNVEGGQYVATSLKESPYDNNPFRPLYGQQAPYDKEDSVSYSIQAEPHATFQIMPPNAPVHNYPEAVGSSVTIQPLVNSEASLSIGVPVKVPGQVVDEKLEIDNSEADVPKETPSKVVFPKEEEPQLLDYVTPPKQQQQLPQIDREVLNLHSKPMYHQLPSDLTPPKEIVPPVKPDHRPIRPPWDPRPGHFYSGKPEYNRPPRPPMELAFKRIDNLPNILPQFRPNMNKFNGPPPGMFFDKRLVRQPLLERPSNRPVGFFEKLQPPPLPHSKTNLRKNVGSPPRQAIDETKIAEDRIMNEGPRRPAHTQEHFGFYQTPPQVKIANRRNSDDDLVEVETLQMIQAKNTEKGENKNEDVVNVSAEESNNENTDKTIYKVYPVNTPPVKLDMIDNNKKESVVIGTRSELPLPPSKINPLFDTKDRNDSPILKPHPRPPSLPVKSDFPYHLERPDPAVNHPAIPETPSNNGNDLDEHSANQYDDENGYFSNNQWNSIGENMQSRIVNGQKISAPNQISVTLKSYTEKPIAVAYTPTEPHSIQNKYSMPNYGSPVIPEIRPNENDKEFTVSAVMHANSQHGPIIGTIESVPNEPPKYQGVVSINHRVDTNPPPQPEQDFQAPFQASVNIDSSVNQGWSVVKNRNKTTSESPDSTTMPYATTSEFDIENFKPHLEGGFKPIYSFPENKSAVSEREE